MEVWKYRLKLEGGGILWIDVNVTPYTTVNSDGEVDYDFRKIQDDVYSQVSSVSKWSQIAVVGEYIPPESPFHKYHDALDFHFTRRVQFHDKVAEAYKAVKATKKKSVRATVNG